MSAREEIKALADDVKAAHPVYANRKRPAGRTTTTDYKRGYCHGYLDALDEVYEILADQEEE